LQNLTNEFAVTSTELVGKCSSSDEDCCRQPGVVSDQVRMCINQSINQSINHSISLYSAKNSKVIRVGTALMSDQLKAVLNRCVFSSALKLVRDEADRTLLGRDSEFLTFPILLADRAPLLSAVCVWLGCNQWHNQNFWARTDPIWLLIYVSVTMQIVKTSG